MCLWGRGSPPAHHSPSSFFSSSSRCHRASQPVVSLPHNQLHTGSSFGNQAGDERLAVRRRRRWWCWWSLPTFIRFLSVATQQKRQEAERKPPQLCSCQCICSVSSSFSPLSFSKEIYGQLLLSLPSSLSVPSGWESEEGKSWMSMDHCSRK